MNFKNPIILGSKSPRRRQLLKLITSDFQAESIEVEEDFSMELPCSQVASYLAEKKANAYKKVFKNRIIITSDTTVILDETILGKPESFEDGIEMLKSLSGRVHKVNTAVNITYGDKNQTLSQFTTVHFPSLSNETITDYMKRFNPVDKAGAYGIQECVGNASDLYALKEREFLNSGKYKLLNEQHRLAPSFIIEKIEGSFFNVVGLPIVEVAKAVKGYT